MSDAQNMIKSIIVNVEVPSILARFIFILHMYCIALQCIRFNANYTFIHCLYKSFTRLHRMYNGSRETGQFLSLVLKKDFTG